MKKLIFLFVVFLLFAFDNHAQTPENIQYQAVLRDASGNIIVNQSKTIIIDILTGSASGTPIFSETHSVTTSAQGIVTLSIGSIESLGSIDWSANQYFVQITVDGVVMGASQLLSVPYALCAKTAETITGSINETDPIFGAAAANGITETDISNWNSKQNELTAGTGITINDNTISATGGSSNIYLGKDTLDGIVYYIYNGSDGLQHGLIVAKTESTAQWQASYSTTNASRSWDGVYNTAHMVGSPPHTYISTNFSAEWYLPSIDELNLLWQSRFHVNKAMNDGGFTLLGNLTYWSSTECSNETAYAFEFWSGSMSADFYLKTSVFRIRAIRAF